MVCHPPPLLKSWIRPCDTSRKSIRFNSIFRPVAGREAGAPPPPEIFRFELNSATKVEFCLLEWTDYQWKLHFPSIVDHSKIMCCCSSAQFRIVQRNEIVFFLCHKRPTALKYLLIFHQNGQKLNGSKCTNDNPEHGLLDLFGI